MKEQVKEYLFQFHFKPTHIHNNYVQNINGSMMLRYIPFHRFNLQNKICQLWEVLKKKP